MINHKNNLQKRIDKILYDLTFKQLLLILYWYSFKTKKLIQFLDYIDNGMIIKYAINKTKHCCINK